ncbi:hypothetical protein PG997_010042 [Apiospora hydei]|uniref:Carrier domain-containing protein n=1 Tax=Apiospora hydei TaxID=1337664 RepID=A0ABR1VZM6_9PEZI
MPVRIRYTPPPSSPSSRLSALPSLSSELPKRTGESAMSFPRVIREASQRALGHAIPWHKILEAALSTTTLPDWPLFDVMVEFSAANDECLRMRLEYSDECFDVRSIKHVAKLIATALDLIVDDRSFEETRESLGHAVEEAATEDYNTSLEAEGLFGRNFRDI